MKPVWDTLNMELDHWVSIGRSATLWWRDDDASRSTAALQRLIAIADESRVPVGIAVIPARLEPSLRLSVELSPRVEVLQHGYSHRNHALPGQKKAELGPHRSLPTMLAELRSGLARLRVAFGERALPALVPPWNRICETLVRRLGLIGIEGLSGYRPRAYPAPPHVPKIANCHVDLIDWVGGRRFPGEGVVVGQIVSHLRARREGRVDPAEPTGLLTHHLEHDEGVWSFLSELFSRTAQHSAARWVTAREAIWSS